MYVVCGWGWGYPEGTEFDYEHRVQQRLKCYVCDGGHLTQLAQQALKFSVYDDAQMCLCSQDEWWGHSEEDGSPNYWIEES